MATRLPTVSDTMNLRRAVIALCVAAFVTVAALGAIAAYALASAGGFGQRVDTIQRRYETLAELLAQVSDYGAATAGVLLMGRDQLRDVDSARIDLERNFARLAQVTRAELETLQPGDVSGQLRELETSRRMVELYHAIDLSMARALTLQRDNDHPGATDVFQREVAFRLTNELVPLLKQSLQSESTEIDAELGELRRLQGSLTVVSAALTALGLVTIGAFAVLAYRAGQRQLGMQTLALGEASERLRDIDARRTQFLAELGHELRTPLTILRGEADVALRGVDDPAAFRQSLEFIQGQAGDLGQLLDELMDFARSDAEAQEIDRETIPVSRVVTAAVQEGEVLAAPREVGLGLTLEDEGAEVDADFRRLKQALIIGLDNAVKHSPPGSQIEVTARRSSGRVTIGIADQGPGIDPADESRVFERFYRGRQRTDVPTEGLGLGLSIAKDIVDRHGGTISLRNGPEHGALLEITLPLAGTGR